MSVSLLPMQCRSKRSCYLWFCSFFRWLSAEFLVAHKNVCSLSVSSIAAPVRFYTVFSTSSTTYSNEYHSARQLFDFHLRFTLNVFLLICKCNAATTTMRCFFLIRERSRGTQSSLLQRLGLCGTMFMQNAQNTLITSDFAAKTLTLSLCDSLFSPGREQYFLVAIPSKLTLDECHHVRDLEP